MPVSRAEGPRDADVREATAKLSQGLETCRAVVKGYRIALAGEPAGDSPDGPEKPAGAELADEPAADETP
jgi:hypothetical protein